MGRRKIPQEVIDYAKELYLTVDEKGRRVYSLRQISTEIQRKFNIRVDPSTIFNRAKQEGWDDVLEQASKAAAIKAVEELKPRFLERDFSAEERAYESFLAVKRQVLQGLHEVFETGLELIRRKKEDPKAVRESFSRLIETTSRAGQIFAEVFEGMKESGEIQVEKVEVILEGFDDPHHKDAEGSVEGQASSSSAETHE